MSIPGFAAAERAWENQEDAPELDEGIWVAECRDCDWQATDRDYWRAESDDASHYLATGHDIELSLEDR